MPSHEDMGRLATELRCLGYFGFGGGYWIAKQAHAPKGTPSPCNEVCPATDQCWDLHRDRVRKFFKQWSFERLMLEARGFKGPALREEMRRRFKGDPLEFVADANAGDGASVSTDGRPAARGPLSLSWPLRPIVDELAREVIG